MLISLPPLRGQVRCCSTSTPVQNSTEGDQYPWTKNAGCSVWGGSDEGSNWHCSKNKTFAEAEAICQAAGARLCTTEELVDGCTAGTGCGFDTQLVWAVPLPPPPPTSPSPRPLSLEPSRPPSPSPPPPSPSPPPQKRPVECGKPDHCSKAAGLKDPNEGHAVRSCNAPPDCPCSSPSHPCAARCAAARRPRPFRIRPKGTSTPGPRTLVALFGVGQMRAQIGTARKTRPSRRLRPSAKRQAPGSAPPRSSWTAVRRARAVDLIRNWSGPSLCRRRRQPRRRQDRYHSSPL